MRNRSKRRAKQERQYNKRVKVWKEENPFCQVGGLDCTELTDDCHHMKGKIELLLLDERYWLPVCRNCHTYLERNPTWAKDNNFSLSRLSVKNSPT